MNRRREEFCKEVFDGYLIEKLGVKSTSWTRVARGQDPPDYHLEIGTDRYAVEVTSTKVLHTITPGEIKFDEETYETSIRKLVEELESKTKDEAILSGLYIVIFYNPFSNKRFSRIRKTILKDLLSFIKATQSFPATSLKTVHHNNKKVCSIFKLQGYPNKIYEVFQYVARTESPEFFKYVTEIINYAVSQKRQKLEQKGVNSPTILLLLNTYGLADPLIYRKCINHVANIKFFHSIFLVMGDASGSFLYSRNREWLLTL